MTEQRSMLLHALRHPRGRYTAGRASQLSGVPQRTVYDWAKEKVLVPDYAQGRPMHWSYRDLVFLRLVAWLRSHGSDRVEAAERTRLVRQVLAESPVEVDHVRTDGKVFLLGDESADRLTGAQVFSSMIGLFDTFDLELHIAEIHLPRLWGPNLVSPTEHTYISPWVMGGEPCVEDTRIPTASLLALRDERGLSARQVVALYPGLSTNVVAEAWDLESRLRRIEAAAA
jgi:uncharacterized protein (DUF433 family)